jgi:hypothetical protein
MIHPDKAGQMMYANGKDVQLMKPGLRLFQVHHPGLG